jgi:predicted RNA-binding Zn ribbon-like protein
MERFGPTRRGGPVFRWLGEPLAIDLANTVMVVRDGDSVDLIGSREDFADWLRLERDRLGECDFALPHLARVRSAREDVRALLGAAAAGSPLPEPALERLNGASAKAPVAAQLRTGGGDPELTEDADEVDDLATLLGVVARSAFRLIVDGASEPVRVCAAPSCGMFFRGRRRWCCTACGNRARAARHYQRRRADEVRGEVRDHFELRLTGD